MAEVVKITISGDSESYKSAAKGAEQATDGFNDELKKNESQTPKTSGKLEELSKKLGGFGSKMQSLGTKMTLGLSTPLALAGKSCITAASDFEENLNKVDVAFGNSSGVVKEWADNAINQFGLSKNQALDATSLFGDMATSMGLAKPAAAGMSTSLAGLAGDLASFKNVDIDQAMNALKGVFTGETESLKGLGIVMTDTELNAYALKNGMDKTTSQMSQAEKVQLRYNYVMDATKNAQGDYARTADGTANSTRTFSGTIENLQIILGEKLLPIFTPIVQGATDLVNSFANADPAIQGVVLGVGGLLAIGGPMLIFLGSMARGVTSMITLFGALKNSQMLATIATKAQSAATLIWNGISALASTVTTSLGAAFTFLTSPIGLVVLAIGAIIAIGALLISHWDEVKAFATDTWENIKGVFQRFDSFLSGIFSTDWSRSFGAIGDILNAFSSNVRNIWSSIKRIFSGITSFVSGVFSGNWSKAWSGIVSIFGGVFGGISAIAKAPINGVIGIVNGAISGLNSISVDIPSWVPIVGGKHFGMNLGKIPYLLHGTDNFQGGFARMNEGGRGELTYLPNGTQVIPHDIAVKYAQESAKANNTSESIDLSGMLDGVTILVDAHTQVDGTTLRETISNYTIKKISNRYRAILGKKGA